RRCRARACRAPCARGRERCRAPSSRRLFAALAHESVDAGNAILDRLYGRRVREADMLAIARNAAAEMDIRQHGDAGVVEEPLAEFFRVGAARALAGLGYVRPRVKRTSRRLARETRH